MAGMAVRVQRFGADQKTAQDLREEINEGDNGMKTRFRWGHHKNKVDEAAEQYHWGRDQLPLPNDLLWLARHAELLPIGSELVMEFFLRKMIDHVSRAVPSKHNSNVFTEGKTKAERTEALVAATMEEYCAKYKSISGGLGAAEESDAEDAEVAEVESEEVPAEVEKKVEKTKKKKQKKVANTNEVEKVEKKQKQKSLAKELEEPLEEAVETGHEKRERQRQEIMARLHARNDSFRENWKRLEALKIEEAEMAEEAEEAEEAMASNDAAAIDKKDKKKNKKKGKAKKEKADEGKHGKKH